MKSSCHIKPRILSVNVHPTTYQKATDQILAWAKKIESRYICLANVHMVMEAYDDPGFRDVVNNADMVTPDGMPLVWILRRMGYEIDDRVCGPSLILWVVREASSQGVPVGFYGGAPDVLEVLVENMQEKFPDLKTAFQMSPPFRELTSQEDENIIKEINTSGSKFFLLDLVVQSKKNGWQYIKIA
jgi:N-acetylglucosaminyldiphosphoundecaprenol N-acetyl-beta-D-mannosaminyltransferase